MDAAARGGLREPARGARRAAAAGERRRPRSRSTAATCRSAAGCSRWSVPRSSTCSRRGACSPCSRRRRACAGPAVVVPRRAPRVPGLRAASADGRDRHLDPPRHRSACAACPTVRPRSGRRPIPHTGFAPRGAQVEPGGPAYPFTLSRRDRGAPPEVAPALRPGRRRAVGRARDMPWDTRAAATRRRSSARSAR